MKKWIWRRKSNTWRLQPPSSNREFVITKTAGELGTRYEVAVLVPVATGLMELATAKAIAEREAE